MKEFEVTIQKYLNTLLSELKKCKSKKKFIELISIYCVIEEIIIKTGLDIDYKEEFDYELKKFNVDKYDKVYNELFMDNYDIMYDYNLEISNIYKKINVKPLGVINYQDYVELCDTIEYVKSFFSYYNKDLYKYFNDQILDNGLLILTDKVDGGCTYLSNYIFPPYSFINPRLCAKDYITIIHETTHSYIRNRLRYINFDQLNQMLVNNLEEVYPIFTELCAIKYSEENSILRDLNKYKSAMYSSLYTYLERYNEDLLNGDILDYVVNESYVYGFLLAYNYYNKYIKNEEDAKEKVLTLSLENPYHDKKYLLNNYGNNQIDLLNVNKYLNNIK